MLDKETVDTSKNSSFEKTKKAISPVVATSLLIIVAVVGIVTFQSWFSTFSTSLYVDIETKSSGSKFEVNRVIADKLYLDSDDDNLSVDKIEINGVDCNIQGNYDKSIHSLDLSSCLDPSQNGQKAEVVVFTKEGILSHEFLVNEVYGTSPQCYESANIGTVGSWPGCNGMLIVNKSMLANANWTSNLVDRYITYDGINYSFGDSQYNVFTGQVTDMSGSWSQTCSYIFTNYSNCYNDFEAEIGFNSNVNYWDVSNVEDMELLFVNTVNFNQPLNNWDVGNVNNMEAMFYQADSFNQDISSWDVTNTTIMDFMFLGASSFNQPLDNWDVSNVQTMFGMFEQVSSFNQDISSWGVSNVEDMDDMFYNATSFNQNLSSWNVSSVVYCTNFNFSTPSWTLPKPNFDPSCSS